jgi:hypothetical protein
VLSGIGLNLSQNSSAVSLSRSFSVATFFSSIQIFIDRYAFSHALSGLADSCARAVEEEGLEPAERYESFFAVLDRDARDSLAAIELVLAQPAISSQLVDNLNASIHLRALLTDLFIIGDIFTSFSRTAKPAQK